MADTIIRKTATGIVATEKITLRKVTWLPSAVNQTFKLTDTAGNQIIFDSIAATATVDMLYERHFDFAGSGFTVDGLVVNTLTTGGEVGLFII